jgi:hypothetical protein
VTGDLRTGENFHASNASLVEHDSNAPLQGYEYAELAPLVRYRHEPGNPAICARAGARPRRAPDAGYRACNCRRGNPAQTHDCTTGLATERRGGCDGRGHRATCSRWSASPDARLAGPAHRRAHPDELLDRARYGQYPPGSTFKLVTAIAALNLNPAIAHRTYLCHTLARRPRRQS